MREELVDPHHPLNVQIGLAHRLAIAFGVFDFGIGKYGTHELASGIFADAPFRCIVSRRRAAAEFGCVLRATP
jgi:hypothetical protein